MLLDPLGGPAIPGIDVPRAFYWVRTAGPPLGGMRFPRADFPWSRLRERGFRAVVSLEPGDYDPSPLRIVHAETLEDLVHGRPPRDEPGERLKVARAVAAVRASLESGDGVVVHCVGGRGRSGTVLGCVLREWGYDADEALDFLDRLHENRGKPGWPESTWQGELVRTWPAADRPPLSPGPVRG